MTEAEWWAATEPRVLVGLLFAQRPPTERKKRLFAHACCTHLWRLHPDWHMAQYLGLAEDFIDGRSGFSDLRARIDIFDAYRLGLPTNISHARFDEPPPGHSAATSFLSMCFISNDQIGPDHGPEILRSALFFASITVNDLDVAVSRGRDAIDASRLHVFSLIFRDIFGPLPFRDVVIAPEWRTSDVTALARGVYVEKAFDRLPILADALQDAGCDSDEILTHLRSDGPHVRGCWALDLILGNPWREG